MRRTAAVLSLAGVIVLALAAVAPAATLSIPVYGIELFADSYQLGGNFGAAVDTDGATAIVSARAGGSGIGSGTAYLFDANNGDPLYRLDPDDGAAGDRFGESVAVAGAYALVGANSALVGNGVGSAYVFDSTTGDQLWKLLPDDGESGDSFGAAVDLSGTTALVGAPQEDELGLSAGAAYLFDVTTGTQLRKLVPDDGAEFAQFGQSVAIEGSNALVGSRLDGASPLGTGAAYVFDTSTGAQLQKFTAPTPATGDRFGESVTLDNGLALVGSPRGGGGPGAAYLFDAATGALLQEYTPSDGAFGFEFGVSVAMGGGLTLIGSSGATDGGIVTGAVYAFDTITGVELFKAVPFFRLQGDNYGVSVAYEGGAFVVGNSFESFYDIRSGAAYLLAIGEIPEPSAAVLMLVTLVGSALRTARRG